MDSSSPTPMIVIETCWPTIETFLHLETSIAIAQTCHSLHRAIIDADSNKLKVSHFEVDNSPFPSSDETPLLKNWHTAPARIPHYLSRSLNSIHFQSLRRLALDFPATKRRDASGHADIIDDACTSSFPIFATNLSFARNLEYLYLNAGRLMATERSGQLEALYEIFAENLGRCRKLRDLTVNNSGVVRGIPDPLHSVALMRAVIPTIQKKKIERLKMVIAGRPSDPLYDRKLSTSGINPVFDFFEAALSVEGLRVLELTMSRSTSHLNALVEAAMVSGATKPLRLTKLRLNHEMNLPANRGHDSPPVTFLSVAPLLEYFSECYSLESIFLNLPDVCWEGEEIIQALRQLLENKPCLTSLTLSFSFFVDRRGTMMKVITECITPNIASKTLCKLGIFGLMDVDENDILQLQLSLQASGMICDKFNVSNNFGGKWDVMIMNNRKTVEGEAVTYYTDAFKDFQWMENEYGGVECSLCQRVCKVYRPHCGRWVIQCELAHHSNEHTQMRISPTI
mmetsp:Transcript_9508/g.16887  ORF Transcript_9508/g.16887 Transcript_9508/m.16887 type:complete len:511 (-) Transcript_9508:33-1565(-)